MSKILVVDDEQDICDILQFNLQTQGYEVTTANSAEEALALPDLSAFDLILLDVMMEGMSGFEMARQMKQDAVLSKIPIIFCTAKDTEDDTLKGFNLGADDYVAKPFRLGEVMARVKAVLRRMGDTPGPLSNPSESGSEKNDTEQGKEKKLVCDKLIVDLEDKRAFIEGDDLLLTRKEYDILALLLGHAGHLYSRQEILDKVWPEDVYVLERSVDVNIARLRKKLREYGQCIVSRSGYGYTFKQ